MTARIEDYALIGDTQTAALVGRNGSIDWLCVPRFDSGACFAALLGTPEHGRWLLAPAAPVRPVRARYLDDTLVLETELDDRRRPVVRVVDFMPIRAASCARHRAHRRGRRGPRSGSASELIDPLRLRLDRPLGAQRRTRTTRCRASPGRTRSCFRTTVADPRRGPAHGRGGSRSTRASAFPFVLTWFPSHQEVPERGRPRAGARRHRGVLAASGAGRARSDIPADWTPSSARSLIVLKALTYEPTGGIVAAATTSLPEWIGGVRNWDYRYCWLRDATLTLLRAAPGCNHGRSAEPGGDWLLRAVAGDAADVQIMYGVARRAAPHRVRAPLAPRLRGLAPVRVGNAASEQLQLDVYGEVLDCALPGAPAGLPVDPQRRGRSSAALLDHPRRSVAGQPDDGIWEVRGAAPSLHPLQGDGVGRVRPRGADRRGVRASHGPVDRWRAIRDEIHAGGLRAAASTRARRASRSRTARGELDASLLLMPLVGFLPASDPRVGGHDRGGRARAPPRRLRPALPHRRVGCGRAAAGRGRLPAVLVLARDSLALLGRHDDARRAVRAAPRAAQRRRPAGRGVRPAGERLLGNFPQAFTHLALVNTAFNLAPHLPSPMRRRHATHR